MKSLSINAQEFVPTTHQYNASGTTTMTTSIMQQPAIYHHPPTLTHPTTLIPSPMSQGYIPHPPHHQRNLSSGQPPQQQYSPGALLVVPPPLGDLSASAAGYHSPIAAAYHHSPITPTTYSMPTVPNYTTMYSSIQGSASGEQQPVLYHHHQMAPPPPIQTYIMSQQLPPPPPPHPPSTSNIMYNNNRPAKSQKFNSKKNPINKSKQNNNVVPPPHVNDNTEFPSLSKHDRSENDKNGDDDDDDDDETEQQQMMEETKPREPYLSDNTKFKKLLDNVNFIKTTVEQHYLSNQHHKNRSLSFKDAVLSQQQQKASPVATAAPRPKDEPSQQEDANKMQKHRAGKRGKKTKHREADDEQQPQKEQQEKSNKNFSLEKENFPELLKVEINDKKTMLTVNENKSESDATNDATATTSSAEQTRTTSRLTSQDATTSTTTAGPTSSTTPVTISGKTAAATTTATTTAKKSKQPITLEFSNIISALEKGQYKTYNNNDNRSKSQPNTPHKNPHQHQHPNMMMPIPMLPTSHTPHHIHHQMYVAPPIIPGYVATHAFVPPPPPVIASHISPGGAINKFYRPPFNSSMDASTAAGVMSQGPIHRGKKSEKPKVKKPSTLKKIILKEREEKRRIRQQHVSGGSGSAVVNLTPQDGENTEDDAKIEELRKDLETALDVNSGDNENEKEENDDDGDENDEEEDEGDDDESSTESEGNNSTIEKPEEPTTKEETTDVAETSESVVQEAATTTATTAATDDRDGDFEGEEAVVNGENENEGDEDESTEDEDEDDLQSPISQGSPISIGGYTPVVNPAAAAASAVDVVQRLMVANNESVISADKLEEHVKQKIHSRRFREYCTQIINKELDNVCMSLLGELVRFQDRLYHKNPTRAKAKRRYVMGIREVTKHLKLQKLKCVILAPNCEKIQSKGGLDDAINLIIKTSMEQNVPFVFALGRKGLGKAVNKLVPISVVGIFDYSGAQEQFKRLVELAELNKIAYQQLIEEYETLERESLLIMQQYESKADGGAMAASPTKSSSSATITSSAVAVSTSIVSAVAAGSATLSQHGSYKPPSPTKFHHHQHQQQHHQQHPQYQYHHQHVVPSYMYPTYNQQLRNQYIMPAVPPPPAPTQQPVIPSHYGHSRTPSSGSNISIDPYYQQQQQAMNYHTHSRSASGNFNYGITSQAPPPPPPPAQPSLPSPGHHRSASGGGGITLSDLHAATGRHWTHSRTQSNCSNISIVSQPISEVGSVGTLVVQPQPYYIHQIPPLPPPPAYVQAVPPPAPFPMLNSAVQYYSEQVRQEMKSEQSGVDQQQQQYQ